MKPLKSGLVFSNWLLRVTILMFIVIRFFGLIKSFEFSNLEYYIGIGFIVFAVLLFIGGFMSKPGLTVISGFVITALSIYKILILFSGSIDTIIVSFLVILSVGFYFACAGNQ